MLLRCSLRQIEYGSFSRPNTRASMPANSNTSMMVWTMIATFCALLGAQLLQARVDGRFPSGNASWKARLFQLARHLLHADAARQRAVDFQRLHRDAAALLRLRNVAERAHVVQPVRQLHDQHAHVARHGEDELLQVLRLLVLFADCISSCESLVTPSTRSAICAPNIFSISSRVASVSSIVSCSSPATMVAASSLYSVRMPATWIGCAKYGSPEWRFCCRASPSRRRRRG